MLINVCKLTYSTQLCAEQISVPHTFPWYYLNALLIHLKDTDKSDPDHDEDYEASGDEEDDEQTILEQEKVEMDVDHEKEIAELEAESKLYFHSFSIFF